jgi:hypothetical protein
MSKENSLRPVSESLTSLFASLVRLARLKQTGKGAGDGKEYIPTAELIMKLGETVKGWDVSASRLFKKDDRIAEVWTDKKTLQQIMVAFREAGSGTWPVAFEVLDENTVPKGAFGSVSQELLAERRNAALLSAGSTVVTNSTVASFAGRKQVA